VIVFELVQTENHPVYQTLQVSNGNRQYDFLRSIIQASVDMRKLFLSQHIIKALNFHAITCLHAYSGEYRPCPVTVGQHTPPEFYRVPALMDDFVNVVNRSWETTDPVVLATYVLWRINNIHPFINGNGRTARAACYFALCLKSGGWLSGNTILPELIRQNHAAHVAALQVAHDTFRMTGAPDLTLLHALIAQLVAQQIQTASPPQSQPTSGPLTTPQQPSAAGTSPQQTSPTAPGQPIVVPLVTPGSTSP
jgi:fido (protein-threonine AMPylation protein)